MHLIENKYKQGQYLLALFMVFLVISCDDSSKNTSTRKEIPSEKTSIKPGSSFSDTMIVDYPSAVFYIPDSMQLKKMKTVTDSAAFDGIMHEYEYLMKNAQSVIKKTIPGLKIVRARNVKYLLFIGADNTKEYIDLDTKSEFCGLFVFNSHKKPQLLDMSNIETGLEYYFFR